MNPKSPTALVIALIAVILLICAPHYSLDFFGNTLLVLAFLGAAFIAIQRHSKT